VTGRDVVDGAPPEVLRTSEVARLLGVSRSTVLSWAYRGLFDYITTPGGQRRFYRDQVEAYLATQNGRPVGPEQRPARRCNRPYDRKGAGNGGDRSAGRGVPRADVL
jgi:excisionase family DNA binding protein